MDVVSGNTLLPGDPRLIDHIVCELKSQGIFDQFRKECIADVDTKPAYQNLRQRVEGSVTGFLKTQIWKPDMNKNQLREALRKNIYESGFLETGVERIVDQVVNPKINTVFLPQVEDVVYKFLGLEKPIRNNKFNGPLTINTTDLLPTDLDPISPDSEVLDKTLNKSDKSNEAVLDDSKIEDFESPPFEPINEQNTVVQMDESSNDSKISGISGLTSHDSNMTDKDAKLNSLDIHNPDSQLSKVSSNSRLSIITNDSKHTPEKMDISDDTQSSSTKEENNVNLFNFDKITDNVNIQQEIKDELEAIRLEINGDSNKAKENEEEVSEKPEIIENTESKTIEEPPSESNTNTETKPDVTNEPLVETKDESPKPETDVSKPETDVSKPETDVSKPETDVSKPEETTDNQQKSDKKPEIKDKDRNRHDSERRRDKDKKSDKDKDKKSSSKSSSSSSSKDKDRNRDKSKESKTKDRERDKKDDKSKDDKSKDKKDEKSKTSSTSSSSNNKSSRDRTKSDSKSSSSSSKKDKKSESKSDEKRKSESSSSKSKEDKEKSSSSSSRSRDHSRSDSSSKSSRDRKSSSSRDHRDKKDTKKSSKRDKDDHSSSREKKDTRRSADRDSNDGSSGIGNTASGNKENSSSNSNKSKSDSSDSNPGSNSDNSGNSDNSQPCQPDDQTSLNIQKSPKVVNLEHKREELILNSNIDISVKIKKPKIASNIFEARKLMKIRKKLEKLEKKRQRKMELAQSQNLHNLTVDYTEDTDSMDSGKLHIHEEEEVKSDDQLNEERNPSVSKASWDEIEAKLNQTVNFDYVDNNDSSSSLTDDNKHRSKHFSEDEDVLYFNDQVSPTTERFLKSVETYQKNSNISSENKMAPPEQERPTKKVKKNEKAPAKRKQNKGKKRKSEDESIFENNNKKINHTINKLAEEFDDMNPSPCASNTSNGSFENKKTKTKKKKNNSVSEPYPLPLSPDSDISGNTIETTAPTRNSRASALKSQRYSSDDLYKPRPFVSGTSRRQRGLLNSTDSK